MTRGRPDQARWRVRARYIAYAVFLSFAGYMIYDAIYPADEFYLEEFAFVALRQPPSSARVAAKSASYPDVHGDYCSYSRFEMAPEDFSLLLAGIKADSRFQEGEPLLSAEKDEALRTQPAIPVLRVFARVMPERYGDSLGLRFLISGKHVDVSVCKN